MAKVTKTLVWILILSCVLLINFPGSSEACGIVALPPEQTLKANIYGKSVSSGPKTPITVQLMVTELPKLYEPTEVIWTINTVADAPNTLASILLPDDAVLISGITNWRGDLYADQSISFSAVISFQKEGRKVIRAWAKHTVDEENSWGDMDAIYLNVRSDRSFEGIYSPGEISDIAKTAAAPISSPIPEQQFPTQSQYLYHEEKEAGIPPAISLSGLDDGNNFSQAAANPGNLTVTGTWFHYDRSGTRIPSRSFLVQLRRASDGAHLAFAYTDGSGNFTIGPVTNPGSAGIRVRIWTYVKYDSTDPTDDELMIIPNGSSGVWSNTYYGETSTYVFPDGTNSVGGWEILRDSPEGTYPNAHAWYIKDDIDRGTVSPSRPGRRLHG